jgi:hypothetical protein
MINATVEHQGSGLSFVPLVGGIEIQGQSSEFIWFYGYHLELSNPDYALTVLPTTNIVINVEPR